MKKLIYKLLALVRTKKNIRLGQLDIYNILLTDKIK